MQTVDCVCDQPQSQLVVTVLLAQARPWLVAVPTSIF